MTQKKIIITLIVLTCLISIDVFASPNKIRANISSQAPVSLHPHDSGTELITNYINQIFDTLMYIDSSGNLKPGLASEWKQVDTKNYVFELRKNVKFHNGEKFNADSVVFTIQKLLDPKEKIDNRFYWGPISGVKKTDEYKVLITLSQPDSLLPYRLATAGHILPPNYHKEVGRAIFARKPIGTGPYRFVKRDSNQNIILKANPQYWNGKPDIDNVELFSSSSIDEAVDKLVEGDLDFVSMVPGHYTKELAKKKNVKTNKAIVNNSAILMLNTKKNGILRNPLVRKALRIGLNMNHIIKYGYSGNGKVTKTLTHENELFHPIQVKEYEFDLIKAKELLIKAGIEKNKEISVLAIKPLDMVGKIVFEQLKELGFSPKIYYGTAEDEKKAILYPNQKGEIPSIDIMISFCAHRFANGSFPMIVLMHSQGTWSVTDDPVFDSLIDKGLMAHGEAEKRMCFRKAAQYISDNNLILPGFQIGMVYGLRDDLDFTPHITGYVYMKDIQYKDKNGVTNVR